jgi:5' nucleotidase, deoxy (Pyrimidine), cytosolic type C protein (NT5C)
MEMKHRLFLDLDGVLANFDQKFLEIFGHLPNRDGPDPEGMWDTISAVPDFFLSMEPMADAYELIEDTWHLSPTILTGVPKEVPSAAEQKRAWVEQWVGPNVGVITCPSKEKYLYGLPGDILIDDWEKYKNKWVSMGGIWITHTSARKSVRDLEKVLNDG